MRKHTKTEVLRMTELVREELIGILIGLGHGTVKADLLADAIIKENEESFRKVLDMPHGGTLPPDELADMILSQYVYKRHGRFSEEAATTAVI